MGRGFPALVFAVAVGGLLSFPAIARAEDTCVAAAPGTAADVIGHTWSGTVVGTRPNGTDDVGAELWTITFMVDRVYAHLADHEFPPNLAFAPGFLFDLPSDNCGRRGDMGLEIGKRYLISTAFIGNGTFIGNLAAWELKDGRASIVPNLYETSFVAQDLVSVKTLADALTLLGLPAPSADPSPSAAVASAPSRGPLSTETPVPTGATSGEAFSRLAAILAFLIVGTLTVVLAVQRRTGRRE